MKLPNKTLERKLFKQGYNQVIGVDEVGMGCWVGPVVVCAVMFDRRFFIRPHPKLTGIRDSKLLRPIQREAFAEKLLKIKNFKFQISYCYPKTIDQINIYQAARLAMRRSIRKLVYSLEFRGSRNQKLQTPNSKLKTIVLVDGPRKINNLNLPQLAITKGDHKVFSIACASIIAKVYRDKMMVRYACKYPEYGFEKHKGYGTKLHQAMLTSLGPTPIHRRSFAPVSKLL